MEHAKHLHGPGLHPIDDDVRLGPKFPRSRHPPRPSRRGTSAQAADRAEHPLYLTLRGGGVLLRSERVDVIEVVHGGGEPPHFHERSLLETTYAWSTKRAS